MRERGGGRLRGSACKYAAFLRWISLRLAGTLFGHGFDAIYFSPFLCAYEQWENSTRHAHTSHPKATVSCSQSDAKTSNRNGNVGIEDRTVKM